MGELIRDAGLARVQPAEKQVIEQTSANVRADYRVAAPVEPRPVSKMCVQRRAGPRAVVLVVGGLVRVARLDKRNDPVPMQHGNVVVAIGRGVPAQKVIVVDADFAGRVMMADVVVVGLGQRYVDDTENQNTDSQGSSASMTTPPRHGHVSASFSREVLGLLRRTGRDAVLARRQSVLFIDYEPGSMPGQATRGRSTSCASFFLPRASGCALCGRARCGRRA